MTRGIVIGKFLPPHKGHQYLIDYALAQVDSLTVLVCDNPAYPISAKIRRDWLQKIHPTAIVRIIPDLNDDDNSKAWAAHTLQFLGYTPDYVFSSEDYGIAYARFMNCEHVMVDRQRTHVGISATKVRNNLIKEWPFLTSVVRSDTALRIAIVGAESTGTTTLARDLAKKFKTPWIPEYGRLYSEGLTSTEHHWTDDEFVHIAKVQQGMEHQIAETSNGIIICDTNAFATTLWQERYMGHITEEVQEIADNDIVDLYILTGDEIPFVDDGTRDGEFIRHDMHQRFVECLEAQNIPYILVSGSKKKRLAAASKAIESLLKKGAFQQSTEHLSRVAVAL